MLAYLKSWYEQTIYSEMNFSSVLLVYMIILLWEVTSRVAETCMNSESTVHYYQNQSECWNIVWRIRSQRVSRNQLKCNALLYCLWKSSLDSVIMSSHVICPCQRMRLLKLSWLEFFFLQSSIMVECHFVNEILQIALPNIFIRTLLFIDNDIITRNVQVPIKFCVCLSGSKSRWSPGCLLTNIYMQLYCYLSGETIITKQTLQQITFIESYLL